ncbi:MAG: TIGR04282 family arsenosugar biosynthesis glycosyltransferase [bacterium]
MKDDLNVGVFAKYPEVGQVKTRLGQDIGMRNAAEFYAMSLGWLLERLHESPVGSTLFVSPPERISDIRTQYNLQDRIPVYPQEGSDLGEKMYNAMEWMWDEYRFPPVIIGSDAPCLPVDRIQSAVKTLQGETAELVLGPAEDGGYYLVGMNPPREEIFQGVDWSTSRVLEQTMQRARANNMSVHLLDEWNDIDRLDDLLERV